jgi:hypothetical protein
VVEAFNASLRRECLSHTLFKTDTRVAHVLEACRDDYTSGRCNTSLGHRSPAEFRAVQSPPSAGLSRVEQEA